YYAINDRAAGRRVIELDLMTSAQHDQVPEDEEITAADRLIVASATSTALIAIRAMAPEPGLMRAAQAAIAAAKCGTAQPEPPPAAPAPPVRHRGESSWSLIFLNGIVMPAPVAGIHVLRPCNSKDVDGRNKSGHDE